MSRTLFPLLPTFLLTLRGTTRPRPRPVADSTAGDSPRIAVIRADSGMDFPLGEQAPDPAKFKRLWLVLSNGDAGELQAAGQLETSGLLKFDVGARRVRRERRDGAQA